MHSATSVRCSRPGNSTPWNSQVGEPACAGQDCQDHVPPDACQDHELQHSAVLQAEKPMHMLRRMSDLQVLALLQLLQALIAQQGGPAPDSAGPTLAFRNPRAASPAAVPPAAGTSVAAGFPPAAQAAGSPPKRDGDDALSAAGTAAVPSPLDMVRQVALKRSQDATEALAALVTGLRKKQELLSWHPSAQVTCSSVARLTPDVALDYRFWKPAGYR